jgi:hypothetical protein
MESANILAFCILHLVAAEKSPQVEVPEAAPAIARLCRTMSRGDGIYADAEVSLVVTHPHQLHEHFFFGRAFGVMTPHEDVDRARDTCWWGHCGGQAGSNACAAREVRSR